jgi:hypothetical protein
MKLCMCSAKKKKKKRHKLFFFLQKKVQTGEELVKAVPASYKK